MKVISFGLQESGIPGVKEFPGLHQFLSFCNDLKFCMQVKGFYGKTAEVY